MFLNVIDVKMQMLNTGVTAIASRVFAVDVGILFMKQVNIEIIRKNLSETNHLKCLRVKIIVLKMRKANIGVKVVRKRFAAIANN